MLVPEIPKNEKQRLEELLSLEILDTQAEERFDRITRLVKTFFDVPIALVSLIDSDRQWFKSKQGLDACQTNRDISFCGHAILGDEIFCIPNALEDERFSDNPLVKGEPHIRFYAGAPLKTINNNRIGTLCIIDQHNRNLSEEDKNNLRAFADIVMDEIWQNNKTVPELYSENNTFKLLIDNVLDSIITIDGYGIIKMCNAATENMFGYSSEELIGKNVSILMNETDALRHDSYLRNYDETNIKKILDTSREVYGVDRNGSLIPLELSVTELPVDDEKMYVGVLKNLTELRTNEKFLSAIVDNIPNMLFVKNARDLRFTLFNKAGEKLLAKSRYDLIGKNDFDIFSKEMAEFFTRVDREVIEENKTLDIPEEKITTPKGERILHTRKTVICDRNNVPQYLLGISEDITDKKLLENKLHEQALKDPLTGLTNRLALYEFFSNEISRAKRLGNKVACVFIDLDNFKDINDKYGHIIGDEVLLECANRFKAYARDIDCACRFGGDEFIFVLGDIQHKDDALQIGKRIKESISKTIKTSSAIVTLSASMGVSIYPDDANEHMALINIADKRMYKNKTYH